MSGDETDCTLGSESKKSRPERGVYMAGSIDNRDVATTKPSRKTSMFYGRTGSGKMLPPLIVYGGAVKTQSQWCSDEVLTDVRDEKGEIIPTVWLANQGGSVDGEHFKVYVERIIIPAAKGAGVRNETGHRAFFFLDGCRTHLSDPATTKLLKDAGVNLYFRVPHTSSVSQGEDTVVFRYVHDSPISFSSHQFVSQ